MQLNRSWLLTTHCCQCHAFFCFTFLSLQFSLSSHLRFRRHLYICTLPCRFFLHSQEHPKNRHRAEEKMFLCSLFHNPLCLLRYHFSLLACTLDNGVKESRLWTNQDTFCTLTSVYIFFILFSLYFPRGCQGDHFLHSHDLNF